MSQLLSVQRWILGLFVGIGLVSQPTEVAFGQFSANGKIGRAGGGTRYSSDTDTAAPSHQQSKPSGGHYGGRNPLSFDFGDLFKPQPGGTKNNQGFDHPNGRRGNSGGRNYSPQSTKPVVRPNAPVRTSTPVARNAPPGGDSNAAPSNVRFGSSQRNENAYTDSFGQDTGGGDTMSDEDALQAQMDLAGSGDDSDSEEAAAPESDASEAPATDPQPADTEPAADTTTTPDSPPSDPSTPTPEPDGPGKPPASDTPVKKKPKDGTQGDYTAAGKGNGTGGKQSGNGANASATTDPGKSKTPGTSASTSTGANDNDAGTSKKPAIPKVGIPSISMPNPSTPKTVIKSLNPYDSKRPGLKSGDPVVEFMPPVAGPSHINPNTGLPNNSIGVGAGVAVGGGKRGSPLKNQLPPGNKRTILDHDEAQAAATDTETKEFGNGEKDSQGSNVLQDGAEFGTDLAKDELLEKGAKAAIDKLPISEAIKGLAKRSVNPTMFLAEWLLEADDLGTEPEDDLRNAQRKVDQIQNDPFFESPFHGGPGVGDLKKAEQERDAASWKLTNQQLNSAYPNPHRQEVQKSNERLRQLETAKTEMANTIGDDPSLETAKKKFLEKMQTKIDEENNQLALSRQKERSRDLEIVHGIEKSVDEMASDGRLNNLSSQEKQDLARFHFLLTNRHNSQKAIPDSK